MLRPQLAGVLMLRPQLAMCGGIWGELLGKKNFRRIPVIFVEVIYARMSEGHVHFSRNLLPLDSC